MLRKRVAGLTLALAVVASTAWAGVFCELAEKKPSKYYNILCAWEMLWGD